MSLCVLMLSRLFCMAMFMDFWWSVKFSLRMGVLEEQDVVVLGVSWLRPQLLVIGNTSNEHFRL